MCGGSAGDIAKDAFSSKGIKQNLLSGGVAWSKDANTDLRQQTLKLARDKGVVPEKKVQVDPAAERAAAEANATSQANARIAFQRKAMRDNSLITGGGMAAAGSGRTSLGV